MYQCGIQRLPYFIFYWYIYKIEVRLMWAINGDRLISSGINTTHAPAGESTACITGSDFSSNNVDLFLDSGSLYNVYWLIICATPMAFKYLILNYAHSYFFLRNNFSPIVAWFSQKWLWYQVRVYCSQILYLMIGELWEQIIYKSIVTCLLFSLK